MPADFDRMYHCRMRLADVEESWVRKNLKEANVCSSDKLTELQKSSVILGGTSTENEPGTTYVKFCGVAVPRNSCALKK